MMGLAMAFLAGVGCGGDGGGGDGGDGDGDGSVPLEPDKLIPGIISEPVVELALDRVSSLAFAPDGRLFVTELSGGRVRIITADGELVEEPFANVEDSRAGLEWGLLAVAIDPEFEENHYVYIYFTQAVGEEPNVARPLLRRYTEENNKATNPETLIEFPMANPQVQAHVGGGLAFGPDGYLYLSIGETQREELAQDLSSPFGKVLRLTRDGEAAPDNPFVDTAGADPRVYAYGLRNTFAIAFDPETGRLFGADNGDVNCDELNIIEAGGNYAWPESFDTSGTPCRNPGGIDPIYHYSLPNKTPAEVSSSAAPTGFDFITAEVYPTLGDGIVACEVKTGFLRRLQLTGPNRDQVGDDSVIAEDCLVAVTTSPDGIVYYSDGGDIRRLPPQ